MIFMLMLLHTIGLIICIVAIADAGFCYLKLIQTLLY